MHQVSMVVGKWAWRNDKGLWVAYPAHLSDAVELAFTSGEPHHFFTSPEGRKYRVEFGTMTQTNLATNGPRTIKRLVATAAPPPSPLTSLSSALLSALPSANLPSSSAASLVASLKLSSAPVWVGEKPTPHSTSTTVKFMVPVEEQELRPGQCMVFIVPPAYRSATVRSVTLAHRKAEKYASTVDENGWDAEPAYNTVTAVRGHNGRYVWRDQYGSNKFAEPRKAHDPEYENLHDCARPLTAFVFPIRSAE